MTSDEIRKIICERLDDMDEINHPESLAHHEGIFRGLLWVLTGHDPGRDLLRNVPSMLDLAEISHREENGVVTFDLESRYTEASS